MVRWRSISLCIVLLSLLTLTSPHLTRGVLAASAAASPAYTITDPDLFIAVPSNAAQQQPLPVLVALHGMGGTGAAFAQDLLATADRNGWLVVAPTFAYQDYFDPVLVVQDDLTFLPRLATILDGLPARTGLQTRAQVLLYGHSRGSQTAHRFATLYPARTLGVAAIAAGSYTLPLATMLVNGRSQDLPMPYGVADLPARVGHAFDLPAFQQVAFRVEVGGADTNPADVPRAWDPYLGTTRVDRAQAYTRTLTELGMPVALGVYPGVGHSVSPAMRDDALTFLAGVSAAQAQRTISAATAGQRCFSATNQCIQGRFLDRWNASGGLAVNGYPISGEFTQQLEDNKQYTVQYFERIRMEYHPEYAAPNDILLGQFGRHILATVSKAPTAPVSASNGDVYFAVTGHNVAADFAAYWQANGGLAQFGYPLSEEFTQQLEDGHTYTVQYFERARFERHLENQAPYNILLGQFGRRVLAETGGAP